MDIHTYETYGCGVFIATLHYLPQYNRFLREHYSYDENVNLRWLYVALLTFYALMFIYAACGAYDTVVGDCLYLGGHSVPLRHDAVLHSSTPQCITSAFCRATLQRVAVFCPNTTPCFTVKAKLSP